MRWTASEISLLRELVSDGCPDAEIADELNDRFGTDRTGNGVALARRRTGTTTTIKGSPPDPAIRSQVLTFLQDGRSIKWIAARRKVTPRVVWKMVQALIRDGLVERVGGSTRNVRYRVTLKWTRDHDSEQE